MSYSVIKYPDYVRKQWALVRHGARGTDAIAYFRSEEQARTAADELRLPLYDWRQGWGS